MILKKISSLLLASLLVAGSLSASAFSVTKDSGTDSAAVLQAEALDGQAQVLDSDSDGVPDYLEKLYHSDKYKADTDGDGLSDYQEIHLLHSDPALKDTDGNRVEDGDEDADGDGLTNLEELVLHTNPAKADTDGDNLSDGEEVNVNKTSPLKADTDGDGLSDYEEIKLGLDPLKVSSDGVQNDADRLFAQTLGSAEIDEMLLSEDALLIPSLSGNVPGFIDERVKISAAEEYLLPDQRAVVGKAVSIDSSYDGTYDLTLSFKRRTLEEAYASDLVICMLRDGKIVPCDTLPGAEENAIETQISAGGIYFVLNAETFLNNLGVAPNALAKKSTLAKKANSRLGQADVVFVIDTSLSAGDTASRIAQYIDTFTDRLADGGKIVPNFAMIGTDGSGARILKNGPSNWFTDASELSAKITQLKNAEKTAADALDAAGKLDYRSSADKFVVLVTDSSLQLQEKNPANTIKQKIKSYSEKGISASVMTTPGKNAAYKELYQKTGGAYADLSGNIGTEFAALAGYMADKVNDGAWVLLNDYQYVKLDGPVSAANGIDTDGDGLSDNEELGVLETRDLSAFSDDAAQTSVSVYSTLSNPTASDSDYDGIDDASDPKPQDNTFTGTLTTSQATSTVNYSMDYRRFFADNETYSQPLSTVSSLWSSVIYSGVTLNAGGSAKAIKALMEYHGLQDVKTYSLAGSYSDNHLSQLAIGHRTVSYNGAEKEIISVSVRGTNGTLQEWSSNFDIGDPNESPGTTDWVVKTNHKGFDVAATRLLSYINTYIRSYTSSTSNKVLWVTGHSRGAGIANIIGARLQNAGYYNFTYTFAAPNTTTASNAASYKSIFNIVNTDDFVPYLPMTAWGFKRYGRTASVSIAQNYEKEWESLVSKFDYNPDTFGMQNTINDIAAVAADRSDCYRYTCKCHGDGTNDTITIINRGMSESSREKAIAKIPVNALDYCIITRYDGGAISGWDFEVCQTPCYFMQLLAAQMSGEIDAYRFAVELNIAKRYEKAKSSIIASAIGGLAHPHWQETYYLLSTHINSSNF